MTDECSHSIFSDYCGDLGGLNSVEFLLYSQILPQINQSQYYNAEAKRKREQIQAKEEAKMNDSHARYLSQIMGERLAAEVNNTLQEKKAAMQRKKEFDKHTNETINDWVTEMKEQATAQEKPLPGMNVSPWASETKKHATAQERKPLGALGRACLMFKILTNIDMTEQQAEKFLDLVKVCEGHTNEQRN